MKSKFYKPTLFILFIIISIKSSFADEAIKINPTSHTKINDFSLFSNDDNIFLLWSSATDGYTFYLSKSTDNGNSFQPEKSTGIVGVTPSIDISDNDEIYITSIKPGSAEGPPFHINFVKSTDGGNSFTPSKIVSLGESLFYGPTVKSFGDNVYLFYGDMSTYDYFFVKSSDRGENFDAPIKINKNPQNTTPPMTILSNMDLDMDGNIYLTWIDAGRSGSNGDVAFAKSIDGGVNFSEPLITNSITSPNATDKKHSPKISVDNNKNIFISYTAKEDFDSENFYSYSLDEGATFSSNLPLGHSKPASLSYDMKVSDDGKIYALQFNNDINWGVRLYQSTNNEDFSSPITISTFINNGGVALSISGTLIHTAWIESDEDTNTESLYFKTFESNAFNYTNITNLNSIQSNTQIYTNNSFITLDLEEVYKNSKLQITIMDIVGNVVYDKSIVTSGRTVNLPLNLATGIYILTIKNGNKQQCLKFVK